MSVICNKSVNQSIKYNSIGSPMSGRLEETLKPTECEEQTATLMSVS